MAKETVKPDVKCKHAEAVQVARTQFQWCPDCGAARYDTKRGNETTTRWHAAKMSRKPRTSAAASQHAAQKFTPAELKRAMTRSKAAAPVPAKRVGRPAAVAQVVEAPRRGRPPKDKAAGIKVKAAKGNAGGRWAASKKSIAGTTLDKPKRHRRTKAEMAAYNRGEQAASETPAGHGDVPTVSAVN